MLTIPSEPAGKIVNPRLALLAARGVAGFSEFGVIVTLAPEAKLPSYMKAASSVASSSDINAHLPCDRIDLVAGDRDVLSVELRVLVTQ